MYTFLSSSHSSTVSVNSGLPSLGGAESGATLITTKKLNDGHLMKELRTLLAWSPQKEALSSDLGL